MPEGDTIYRTAGRLRSALGGKPIDAAESRLPRLDAGALGGRRVTSVEARGKHLLIHLDDGGAIHSHLGMTGAWHVYRAGEPWRKPRHRAQLVLQCGDCTAVCFTPKTLERLSPDRLRRHDALRQLGPDLLGRSFDAAEVVRRFRLHNATPIGEAVLNQSIASGVGNVYKSEVLFLTRTDPFVPVGDLTDDQIADVVDRARRLMARNLDGFARRTRFGRDGGRLWVYGRSGKPCYVCGTPIRIRRQGDQGRTTYWCPECQQSAD